MPASASSARYRRQRVPFFKTRILSSNTSDGTASFRQTELARQLPPVKRLGDRERRVDPHAGCIGSEQAFGPASFGTQWIGLVAGWNHAAGGLRRGLVVVEPTHPCRSQRGSLDAGRRGAGNCRDEAPTGSLRSQCGGGTGRWRHDHRDARCSDVVVRRVGRSEPARRERVAASIHSRGRAPCCCCASCETESGHTGARSAPHGRPEHRSQTHRPRSIDTEPKDRHRDGRRP